MTIERAREILGDDIKHLTDEEVQELNAQTAQMARAMLYVIQKDIKNNKDGILITKGESN